MSANPLSSLVQAIVSDPSSLLATALSSAFSSRLGLAPDSVELALKAYASDNNLTRAALVGLLLEGLYKDTDCRALGPVDPMRSPASGFTIRDVVKVPEQVKQPKAHSRPDLTRQEPPSAIPMIVEVVSTHLEARPDLVAVVETALEDEPSESTQVLRAFVAGFRGYNDCPDVSKGRADLAAAVSQLLALYLGETGNVFSREWFSERPWTAVLAAPLAKATFGSIVPGEPNDCTPQAPESALASQSVPIAEPSDPEVGDGSGSGDQEITSIYNLWAMAIPDEVSASVDRLFWLKSVLRMPAAQLLYVPTTDKDPQDYKRFLGQANFDAQVTLGEFLFRCDCQGPVAPGKVLSSQLATLAVGDKTLLRSILTDEMMISISSQLPFKFVPWDRSTELVPSDLYLLKPIPKFGIAVSTHVRIWQAQLDNAPFVRLVVQDFLANSIRAVISPCDVATFTPDPLLCVARTGKMPPGTNSSQVSSTTNNYLQNLNIPSSSSTPGLTLYRDQSTNQQAAAIGPNVIQPSYIQDRVAKQAWIETEAPSISTEQVGESNPNEPQLGRTTYLSTLFPLGDMYQQVNLSLIPLSGRTFVIPLERRIPLSTQAFLDWVNEKLDSYRSFRTPAQRAALVRNIPVQFRIYLGLTAPLVSGVQAFLAPQLKPRSQGHTPTYRATRKTFGLPRETTIGVFQGQIYGTGLKK